MINILLCEGIVDRRPGLWIKTNDYFCYIFFKIYALEETLSTFYTY